VRTRLQIVGVVAAMLVGLVVPAALAQGDGEAPTWWKCDERGRCVFEGRRLMPWFDPAAVDEMNEWAESLAAAFEDAGIDHEVLTVDVVTWDRNDPEANRVAAEFWGRTVPVPGEGFVPWAVPDRLERYLEFEGIWPDDLFPMLEEWLGEGFPDDLPLFGERLPRRFTDRDVGDARADEPPELFDEEGRPLGPGGLGALLEEFLGGEEGLGSFLEEMLGGEGALGGRAGPLSRLDETMRALAEHLEEHGVDTVTIEGPMGVSWVVWDFFDEDASDLVAEFLEDRWTDGARRPGGDAGSRGQLPEWDWPFDGGGR